MVVSPREIMISLTSTLKGHEISRKNCSLLKEFFPCLLDPRTVVRILILILHV